MLVEWTIVSKDGTKLKKVKALTARGAIQCWIEWLDKQVIRIKNDAKKILPSFDVDADRNIFIWWED